MSDAREAVLARIRAALGDVPEHERPEGVAVARDYRHHDDRDGDTLVALLCERLIDYGAQAALLDAGALPDALAAACADLGLVRLAVPPGLPAQWRPGGLELVEDAPLDARALDDLGAVLTGCALAVAETGTLVLDGGAESGRRVLTLIPDHHLCVVRASQVVGSVPDAVRALRDRVVADGAPVTLVSGPSASSDIELDRVEGVHGPRDLRVFVIRDR